MFCNILGGAPDGGVENEDFEIHGLLYGFASDEFCNFYGGDIL